MYIFLGTYYSWNPLGYTGHVRDSKNKTIHIYIFLMTLTGNTVEIENMPSQNTK